MFVEIKSPADSISTEINLPASKSISNRLLMIRAISGQKFLIENLSEAEDTVTLDHWIQHPDAIEHCGAGGTTMRFLLALRALQGKHGIITGIEQLRSRPIAELVSALKELGADIRYTDKENYLPVELTGGKLNGKQITIPTSVSSQFISALLLIAPAIENGLTIHLKGEIVSAAYIEMTIDLLRDFGVDVEWENDKIVVQQSKITARNFYCPPDWTAASYWYAFTSCGKHTYRLKNLATDHYQGDSAIIFWMEQFGVQTIEDGNDLLIQPSTEFKHDNFEIDFTGNPDIAQTFAILAAVKGISGHLTGLSTLKNKETDRLAALKTELEKTGVIVIITNDSLQISGKADPDKINNSIFETYNDHRMAMALSILSRTGAVVKMENPQVVKKSYPTFFEDLKSAGFEIKYS